MWIWVLGAPDPEMSTIEALLLRQGQAVVYATAGGQRVHPGNAYAADLGASFAAAELAMPAAGEGLVLVECGDAHLALPAAARCDHHRPGDPGYGRPPADFLPASSLGQVLAMLNTLLPGDWPVSPVVGARLRPGRIVRDRDPDAPMTLSPRWVIGDASEGARVIPSEIVLAAASDHCLAAAYEGQCPGVDPDALMAWRASTRAAHQGRHVDDVLADVAAARALLRVAPRRSLGGARIADMRPGVGAPCGAHRVSHLDHASGCWGDVPELPEAAAREGIAFIAIPRPGRDGSKLVLQAASTAAVEAFLAGDLRVPGGRHVYPDVVSSTTPCARCGAWWDEAETVACLVPLPLERLYGDPARGFGGGYIPEPRRGCTHGGQS